jgi:deazaflavin-dependent oxidoreductase (nitroreductase family)
VKIPDRIRFINKRYTNRMMGLIAGKRFSPIALLHHTGRKTGRQYAIPVIAAKVPGGFVFALTYGDHVDWYRNIRAAGSVVLISRGSRYELRGITPLTKAVGRAGFKQPFDAMLKAMDIEDFFRMEIYSTSQLHDDRPVNTD